MLILVAVLAFLSAGCTQTTATTTPATSVTSPSGGGQTASHQTTPSPKPKPDAYIPVVGKPPIASNVAQLIISNPDVRGQNIKNGEGRFLLNFSGQIVVKNYDTMVFALVDNATDPGRVTDTDNNLALLDFPLNIDDGAFPAVNVMEPCGPKNFRMDALVRDANTSKVYTVWSSPPVTVNLDCGSTTLPPYFISGFWQGYADNATTNYNGYVNFSFSQDSTPQQSGSATVYNITGRLMVVAPFRGSGPLNGTIDTQGNISFHVVSDQVPGLSFDFKGAFKQDGSGTPWIIYGPSYTVSTGEHGVWGANC
jgi:hypothetical protein